MHASVLRESGWNHGRMRLAKSVLSPWNVSGETQREGSQPYTRLPAPTTPIIYGARRSLGMKNQTAVRVAKIAKRIRGATSDTTGSRTGHACHVKFLYRRSCAYGASKNSSITASPKPTIPASKSLKGHVKYLAEESF